MDHVLHRFGRPWYMYIHICIYKYHAVCVCDCMRPFVRFGWTGKHVRAQLLADGLHQCALCWLHPVFHDSSGYFTESVGVGLTKCLYHIESEPLRVL